MIVQDGRQPRVDLHLYRVDWLDSRGTTQPVSGSGQDRSRHGDAGVGRLNKWRPRAPPNESAPC